MPKLMFLTREWLKLILLWQCCTRRPYELLVWEHQVYLVCECHVRQSFFIISGVTLFVCILFLALTTAAFCLLQEYHMQVCSIKINWRCWLIFTIWMHKARTNWRWYSYRGQKVAVIGTRKNLQPWMVMLQIKEKIVESTAHSLSTWCSWVSALSFCEYQDEDTVCLVLCTHKTWHLS